MPKVSIDPPAQWVANLEAALYAKQQPAPVASLKKRLHAAAKQLQHAPDSTLVEFVGAAIALSKKLHASGRDGEALPLARLCVTLAERVDCQHYPRLLWQSVTATGILLAHQGQHTAAINEHSRALQLAEAAANVVDQAKSWGNLGNAFKYVSAHSLAIDCYTRAYQQYSLGPVFSRYAALVNIAHCQLHLGQLRKGLAAARLALRYETTAFRTENPYSAAVLRNNLVRLLVAAGKKEAAARVAEEASLLAQTAPSELMDNLMNVLHASLDIAHGRFEAGINRLQIELQRVRHLPEPRNDTLAELVNAEQAAGNPMRAWIYWQELVDHLRPHDSKAKEWANSQAMVNTAGDSITLELEEQQMLHWLADGHSSKAIARFKAGNDTSVRTYLSRLYGKIGVKNGRAAVAWLLQHQQPARPAAIPAPPVSATPRPAKPLYGWYLRCLAKGQGQHEAAIDHWQSTPVSERPATARYAVALMFLLQSQVEAARAEAPLLQGATRRALQLAEQWLIQDDSEGLRRLQELMRGLPVDHADKPITLLALCYRARHGKTAVDQTTLAALDMVQDFCEQALATSFNSQMT